MIKKKLLTIAFCLCGTLTLLCGCKSKNDYTTEDNPANHGVLAIMETENGYYYNYGTRQSMSAENFHGIKNELSHLLRYYDKDAQETILLCNKPECEHQGGDTCTATYKNISVINTLLYEGQLYVYGMERDGLIASVNLYKASLDGSSFDKIGTVIEAENTLEEGIALYTDNSRFGAGYSNAFIIHKGYAYLPYYLRFGSASRGFMGGGLMQMDLRTGETKSLYEMDFMTSDFPYELRACGDYVYMNSGKTTRYVISEDRMEAPLPKEDMKKYSLIDMVTADRIYTVDSTWDKKTRSYITPFAVYSFDALTGASVPEETFDTDITPEEYEKLFIPFAYEDKLVMAAGNRVIFYGRQGKSMGQKLGEINFEYEAPDYSSTLYESTGIDFKISNDKLYCIRYARDDEYYDNRDVVNMGTYRIYEVFSCPLKDILKGEGKWTKEFEFGPQKL